MSQREQDPSPSGDDGTTTTRRVRWLERTLMALVVAASTLALSAHRLGASPSAQAPVSSLSVASSAPTPTPTPTQTPLVRAIVAQAQPASVGQTQGVAAMVRLDGVSDISASDLPAQAAASVPRESSEAAPQDAGAPSATGQTNGDSRPPAAAPIVPAATPAGQAPPQGATEALGPAEGGSPGPVATTSPSPYANDTLTDLSKVPDAQWINWPAYTPQPHKSAVPTLKGTGTFLWPTSGFISTPFKPEHQAIDIANDVGTPIFAADSGTVVFADVDYGGLGNATEIDHGNGYVTTYGHQSKILVKEGDVVVRGQLIGLMGSTGHSTGPHLHFVIKKDGQTLNPLLYVKQGLPPAPHPQVAVPDFTDMSAAKATQIAQTYRLSLKVLGSAPSNQVPAGGLFGQDPTPNSLIDVSATVSLHVSSGQPTPTATATATPTSTATSAPSTTGPGLSQTAQASPSASTSPSATNLAPVATAMLAGDATRSSEKSGAAATATTTPPPSATKPAAPGTTRSKP